jgi:prepilin-type N-terminal cleavage/methylation domain-containing protein
VKVHESWSSERGFTLAEVMITIVIMGILAAVAMSFWWPVVESRRVDSATNQVVSDLRLAHTRSINRLDDWQVDPRPPGGQINSYRIGPCGDSCGTPLDTPLLFLDECGETCPPSTMFPPGMSGVRVVFYPDGGAQFFGAAGNIIRVAAADGSPCRQIQVNTVTSRVKVLPNAC